MSPNYEEEIRAMVSEILEVPVEKLTMDVNFFEDLNVDSLKAIEIVAAFEKKYRIIVPEEEIPKITNLEKLVEYTKNIKG
ncbi:MAG TPA: acyl carrier protein [Nitrospirae bacterium]|nr:acyl carrier protein [bacterium BMS3Abin09]HDH49940.1 acyl carrier protein [Nitrospirota bacterium]HDK16547.1 acyl carrier protein [Nitrospirota bacterium]HDY70681.1 acyl carrier protein [Nitrospirota bacterium]